MATTQKTTGNRSVVVGVFEDRTQAQRCVDELRRAGFREDQIGVAGRDTDGSLSQGKSSADGGTMAAEGAAAGVAAGAGVGALWALGIAAGVLPVIGPVIAGGLLAAVLASAAGGAAAAGLIGALIGLGIPEDEAEYYEGEFQTGRIIVTVRGNGRYDEALALVRRFGGYDRSSGRVSSATSSHTAATHTAATGSSYAASGGRTEGERTVQLKEEQLHAQKHAVDAGEVRVRKEVVTEHKTINVPVEREEVVIERHAASGQRATSSDIRAGEEIRIPVKEEKVRVEKDTVVKEEVRVGKRKVQDTEQVSATVRKEELRVEQEGDVDVRDQGKSSTRKK